MLFILLLNYLLFSLTFLGNVNCFVYLVIFFFCHEITFRFFPGRGGECPSYSVLQQKLLVSDLCGERFCRHMMQHIFNHHCELVLL